MIIIFEMLLHLMNEGATCQQGSCFFCYSSTKNRMCVRSQSNYWIRLYSIYQLNLKYKLHKQLEATGMDQFTFTDMKK